LVITTLWIKFIQRLKTKPLLEKLCCLGYSLFILPQILCWWIHAVPEQQHENGVQNSWDETALAVHSEEVNHNFAFNNVKILVREKNDGKRKVCEIVKIIKNNCVNFKTDTKGLTGHYVHILEEDLVSDLDAPACFLLNSGFCIFHIFLIFQLVWWKTPAVRNVTVRICLFAIKWKKTNEF